MSPCWTLPGATRKSLVKFGVASGGPARIVRVIADVGTHVTVAEAGHVKLKVQISKANGTEKSMWFVQSSLYFVGEKSRLSARLPIELFPQPTMWVS